jgi:hypothetical protein
MEGKFSYGAEVQECTIMGIDRLISPERHFTGVIFPMAR